MSNKYLFLFFFIISIGQSQEWDVSITIQEVTGSSFEIYMINNEDVAGAQIQFSSSDNFEFSSNL